MREYFKYLTVFLMCMFLYADCEDFTTEADCDAADHCEWHADEMACEDEGGDHDHDEHCEDFTTEADCDAADHCEWHADEMACEDEGGDHDHDEHCEDFTTEVDCDAADHCEWHADEMACEDEGGDHDHDEHCEDFTTEADCDAADHCEWHADEMACEDEGDDHDHEHCEDFDNQVDCEASDDCEWHDHGGESVCEDAGSHCEDFDNQADCEASDHCEWHEHGGENVCEDIGGDCDSDAHANVDGLIIEHDGVEIYRQFQGLVEGSLEVPVNYTKDLSVHFLDQDGEEIDFSPAECYPIYFHDYDMSIISIEMEEGDDHDHDHDHDDHEGNVFELTGLSTGFTTFQIEVWHDGHADYTSMQIPVTVIDEVHCEDFITESDCEDNSEYCEWHADEGACEEEGHDHEEHCEDFATEADCDAADHCEWHADDMACEDEGHHEDCDGLDGDVNNDSVLNIIDITTTVAVLLGNYAWTDECQETYADFNDDGSVNIVDIVTMVQAVLNGRINDYATLVQFEKTNSGVTFEANGYVGAIQMTLSHNSDFKLDITNNAMISDYKKTDNLTTLIIVAPEDNNLFSSEGFFNIENVVAASSDNYINTEVYTPADFTISNAYPNPFNPSTSFSIELSADSDISIKVFDVMGNLVEVVSEGEFSPGSYAFNWNAESASSGVYFINTVVGNSVSSQKVLLVK